MQSNEEIIENIQYSEEEAEIYRRLKLIAEVYEVSSVFEREEIQEDNDDGQGELEIGPGDKHGVLETLLLLPYTRIWIIMQHCGIIILSCIILAALGITKFTKKQMESLVTVSVLLDGFFSVDFFLSLIYRQRISLHTTSYYKPKSVWRLVLAVLSLIPFEQIYKTFSTNPDEKLYPVFSLNRLLRLNFLLIYIQRNRYSMTESNSFLKFWRYTAFIIIFSHIAIPMLLYYNKCNIYTRENCQDSWIYYYFTYEIETGDFESFKIFTNEDLYWIVLYLTVGRVTTNSLGGELLWKTKFDFAIFCLLTLFALILYMPIIIAPNVLNFVHEKKVTSAFMENVNVVLNYLDEKNVDRALIKRVKHNYEVFWIKYKGLGRVKVPFCLPDVSSRILTIDIFWEAYQHSHIFRDTDFPFLRVLALYFQTIFYLPGDIICKKYELKTKFIYVVTGVIQILSEEDDQTPVILLAGGTCLGEITLVMSYKSTAIVKCATYCELYVLDRRSYCSYLTNYPYHQKAMHSYVMQRFESAKILYYISTFLRSRQKTNTYSETTVGWVNKELLKLMEMEEKNLTDEDIFYESDASIYDTVQHTAEFLDLLVLSEKLVLETERACLRGHFPWIVHPNSTFIKIWNAIVIFTILVLTILIPQNAVYTQSFELERAILFMTIVFLIDLYIQLTTAIKSKDELIVDIRRLFYLKFMQMNYIVDLIGSIPAELSVYIFYEKEDNIAILCFLQLNRLIRFWKIEALFRQLENTLHANIFILHIIKYFMYMLLFVYLYACVLFHETCENIRNCNPYGWLRASNIIPANETSFIIPYYYSTMVITGLSLRNIQPTNIENIKYILAGYIISSLLFIYITTGIISSCILARKQWYDYLEIVRKLHHFMVTREIDRSIKQRVQKLIYIEWQQHKGLAFSKHGVLSDMPKHLKDEVSITLCASAIKQVKYFEDTDEEFINKLATLAEISLIPKNEIVTYAGSVAQHIYIILNGYCKVLSSVNNSVIKVIGPNSNFSGMEMFFEILEPHTVRTITTSNIITLNRKQLSIALSLFPEIENEFLGIIKSMQGIKRELRNTINTVYKEPENINVTITRKSIYYFGCMLKTHTPRGDDYLKPFDKLSFPLKYIRYLLLRFTFLPDGQFIKFWECSRVIFAFVSSMIFPTFTIFYSSGYSTIINIRYLLDALAYLDLYVRMHVCYYKKDGIIVKHPLKTTAHYFKNGFLLDFLACFPIEIFYTITDIYQYKIRGILVYNRLLQMHRIYSGIKYKNCEVNVLGLFHFVKYVPFLLVTINASGILLIKLSCNFHPNLNATQNYTAGVFCHSESWVTGSSYLKHYGKLSPFKVYLLGLYLATSVIFRVGFPGCLPQNLNEHLCISIIAILGYFCVIVFSALIAASRTHKSSELINYQEEMKSMNQFMERRQIPHDLRKEAIEYFEILWKNKKGHAAHELLNNLYPSLKYDALYNMYSTSINLKSVLSGANITFYHSLLTHAFAEFYTKRTKIFQINDISDRLYIVHKGRVEVKSIHGNKLAVLYSGAIFGNIKNVKRARISIVAVPMGQVELLVMETKPFYDVLSCYPQMKIRFDQVTKIHTDYIPSIHIQDIDDMNNTHYADSPGSVSVTNSVTQHRIIQPDSLVYMLWEIVALIIGGYISFGIIVYQICAKDYMLRLFIIGYFFDLCYIIKPYIKLRLAYKNELGEMVTSNALIRQRYFRSILGFVLDLITITPFELLALAFPSNKLFYFALFRINRLPRIFMVFEFFELRKNKLNVHVFLMRVTFAFVWWSLVIHTLVCIQIFRLCTLLGCSTIAKKYTNSYLHLYLMITYEILGITSTTTFVSILDQDTTLLLYYTFAAILCYYCLALFMGEIISIIDMVTFSLSKYVTEINKLLVSMKKNNVSPAVHRRFWFYLILLWDTQRGRQYPTLLRIAPYYIQEKVNMCIYSQHLRNCYIFSRCEEDLIRQIAGKMREITFFPGHFITHEGDMDETMYFIHRGKVEVYIEDELSSTFKELLYEGQVFGLTQGLFHSMPHDYTYRAKTKVVIITLKRTKWEHILDFFPASKESIFQKINV